LPISKNVRADHIQFTSIITEEGRQSLNNPREWFLPRLACLGPIGLRYDEKQVLRIG